MKAVSWHKLSILWALWIGGFSTRIGTAASFVSGRRAGTAAGVTARTSRRKAVSESATPETTAVVVGGGPGGLATALVLSNVSSLNDPEAFWFDRIVVLDAAPTQDYDPSRAYLFNINRRGQRFTDAFGIDLSQTGSPITAFARLTVPADPAEAFDDTKIFKRDMTPQEKENFGTNYWITRPETVALVESAVREQNKASRTSGKPVIDIRRGLNCEYIEPIHTDDGNNLVKIVCQGANNNNNNEETECFVANLCVGADGIASSVRQSLEDGRFDDPARWTSARPNQFRLNKRSSPALGLRFKGLRIDRNFRIPKGGSGPHKDTLLDLDPRYNYQLLSTTTGARDSMPLTILPQKNPDCITLNICTEANHDLWNRKKIRTDDGGTSAKAFFAKAHPRYDWDQMVSAEEWDLFCRARGARFPHCQYVPGMYVASRENPEEDASCGGGSGVVLVGDALHAFPPDLGQGVNAAFDDAMALGKAFADEAAGTNTGDATSSFLSRALRRYQDTHGPETRALIQLARCGAPFQYRQASAVMKVRKTLWIANFFARMTLSKLTSGMTPKPAIMMMMDPNMSYRRIMSKANTLTKILWSAVLVVALSLLRKSIVRV